MSSRPGPVARGVLAGAVGSFVLEAAGWLDVALTGRSVSGVPGQVGLELARRAGLDLPTDGDRPEAYGALAGAASGVGVAVLTSLARAGGVRLPLLAEAAVAGVGAMALADTVAARLGVSEPTDWSGGDWVRDAVPHLAYGLAVATALRRLSPPQHLPPRVTASTATVRARRRRPVLLRSLVLGVAAGSRSTLGLPRALAVGPRSKVVYASLTAAELVADKLPAVPSRLEPGPALGRIGSGALGAAVLARREDAGTVLPLLAGGIGALAGAVLGATWREVAADRGWTWQGAAAEDVAALALAAWALGGTR